eukprot:CAMPEP_0119409108 /NCGR_PEP_ID=MMETSP1335-20130426/2480_1 /TAXON_ID=259385 /ORGANISM="Chrysoculter rhomboideus, Strain RCC1486" /LENGTH=71 /DNA_ID=CAMNT_0007433437 /DNA_START=276 /DNA_END=492 /DNA_ORIENTATION=+
MAVLVAIGEQPAVHSSVNCAIRGDARLARLAASGQDTRPRMEKHTERADEGTAVPVRPLSGEGRGAASGPE